MWIKTNTNQISQYKKWENDLNFDSILVSLKSIDQFKRHNTHLNINVFGYDGVELEKNN